MSSMKDLKNNLKVVQSIAPQSLTADENGAGVDRSSFEAVTAEFSAAGTGVDGTVKIQDSDDNISFADVAADFVLGTQGEQIEEGEVKTLGYVGGKKYVRGVFTHTADGEVACNILLSSPNTGKTGAN